MNISTRTKYVISGVCGGLFLYWIEPTGWATIAWVAGFTMGTFWGIHKEKVGHAYRESLKSSQKIS